MPISLVTVEKLHVAIKKQPILTNIHFSIQEKEVVTVVGPNGAGKTTLAKTLLGLIKPSHGVIQKIPGLRLGYMPQTLVIEPLMPLSVARFLNLVPRAESKAGLNFREELLETLALKRLSRHPVQSLSGGEWQRVLFARTLLQQSQLLVLDEPVQGLDVEGQSEFYRLLLHYRDRLHFGVLMISHDLHLVMSATDKVICLNNHICCTGTPEVVTRHPDFLNLFVHNPNHAHAHTHAQTPYSLQEKRESTEESSPA